MKENRKKRKKSKWLHCAAKAYERLDFVELETQCHELVFATACPTPQDRLYAHCFLAQSAMHLGHSDEAVRWLLKAKEEINQHKELLATYFYQEATLAHQRAHYQEALFAIENARKTLSKSKDARLETKIRKEKILILANYGDMPKAQALCERLGDEEALTKGRVAFIKKEYENSLALFARAEELADNESAHIKVKEEKAAVLACLARIEEAVELLDECLLMRRDFNGEGSAANHIPIFKKGQLLTKVRAYTDAEQAFEVCFDILVNHCLPTHPWMLALAFERSLCTYLSGQPRSALQELVKTLDGLKTIYGYEHPLVVRVLITIAKVQLSLGNGHKALPAAKDAHDAACSFLLPNHDMVAKSKELLVQCEEQLI